jgi:hypothetical protein
MMYVDINLRIVCTDRDIKPFGTMYEILFSSSSIQNHCASSNDMNDITMKQCCLCNTRMDDCIFNKRLTSKNRTQTIRESNWKRFVIINFGQYQSGITMIIDLLDFELLESGYSIWTRILFRKTLDVYSLFHKYCRIFDQFNSPSQF